MTNAPVPVERETNMSTSFVIRHSSFVIVILLAAAASAQPPVHRLYKSDMPPGQIGRTQLLKQGRAGYYQPVEVRGPKGSLVSLASEGDFLPAESNVAWGGMLIGEVYRVRIANIAEMEGTEVFPSIEVIDRLCPPPGQAARFPIPIEIEKDDLELAASGKYVMRIIYVEDPKQAVAIQDKPDHQRVYEARPYEDPLAVADEIGRPVAILRMGSRTPDVDANTGKFLFDSPSLMLYDKPPKDAPRNSGLELPLKPPPQNGRESRNFQRLPEGMQRR
jgi:hypothetical protein